MVRGMKSRSILSASRSYSPKPTGKGDEISNPLIPSIWRHVQASSCYDYLRIHFPHTIDVACEMIVYRCRRELGLGRHMSLQVSVSRIKMSPSVYPSGPQPRGIVLRLFYLHEAHGGDWPGRKARVVSLWDNVTFLILCCKMAILYR